MQLRSRPGFYVIMLLIATMLMLTFWLAWRVDTIPSMKRAKETAPASVSGRP